MHVGVLGPLVIDAGGRDVRIAARMERVALAALVSRANQVVSVDRLTDALWGDEPPRSAGKTLQTYIVKLRRVLGGDRIVTQAPGYLLSLADDELDVTTFEALVEQGRAARVAGDPVDASKLLGDALGLWRGDAYEEMALLPHFRAESVRLDELRATVVEELLDARLALGQHGALVAQLEALVEEHPLRERLWAMLMLAMYRSGRQADALGTYQRARAVLLEDMGIDPGVELRTLEHAILTQDASLAVGPPAREGTQLVVPPTRYARSGAVHLAYQVTGSGPPDVLMVNEWWSHIEAVWEFELPATFLRHMTSLARVVHFDGRGGGMSDPVSRDTRLTLEGWADDALAVLNAAGLGRVVVFGQGNGAALAVLLAATNPDRVSKLILHNANLAWAETSMAGTIGADVAKAKIMARWGSGPGLPIAPSLDSDESFGAWFGRWQRLAVSPGQLPLRLDMVVDTDVRPAEAAVAVPTLVLHAEGNRIVPLSAAQRLASSIAGARLVVLDGEDHLWCSGDHHALFDAVGAFLAEPDREPGVHAELATALVAKIGAAPDRFLEALTRVVTREQGTLHRTGERLLAVFDGPARAVACAVAIADMAQHQGVAFAGAIHTGLVERGPDGPSGTAISVAGTLYTRAEEGEVLLTRTVVDLIAGSGLDVEERDLLATPGYDGGTFAVTTR